MSTIRAARQAAGATWRSTASRRPAAWAATVSAATMLLATACGNGSPGPAAPPSRLYQLSLTYSRCMRSHGVPDFPILKQGPRGSLVHPVSPPTGMLTAPGYDAAFRACLRLAVIDRRSRARYQAAALRGLRQAECMRGHRITRYPSPGTLDGGIHSPDLTAIGLDPHTLQFQAAAEACGMEPVWQVMWWWPAPDSGHGGNYSAGRWKCQMTRCGRPPAARSADGR